MKILLGEWVGLQHLSEFLTVRYALVPAGDIYHSVQQQCDQRDPTLLQ